MRLVIDNTTRFFTVVGAPYIPARTVDGDFEGRGAQRGTHEIANPSLSRPAGSWLSDDC